MAHDDRDEGRIPDGSGVNYANVDPIERGSEQIPAPAEGVADERHDASMNPPTMAVDSPLGQSGRIFPTARKPRRDPGVPGLFRNRYRGGMRRTGGSRGVLISPL